MRLGDLDALKHRFAQITYTRFTADMGQGGFEMFSEKEIEDIIDNAPTVPLPDFKEGYKQAILDGKAQYQRPKGEWITIHKQNSFGQDCICFECDKCHKYIVPIYKLMITEPLEVCPNCGADMMKGGADMRGEKE